MINNNTIYSPLRWFIRLAYGSMFLSLISMSATAQEMPPRPISVTVSTTQNLSFGNFTQSALGGTVSVSSSGIRSWTGNIILLSGSTVSPARFDITANPGTLITIVNGSDVTLNGSGGGTLTLHIGTSSTGSPFITTQPRTSVNIVYIGGTLTVGSLLANPPGNYSGTFQITFIQQ